MTTKTKKSLSETSVAIVPEMTPSTSVIADMFDMTNGITVDTVFQKYVEARGVKFKTYQKALTLADNFIKDIASAAADELDVRTMVEDLPYQTLATDLVIPMDKLGSLRVETSITETKPEENILNSSMRAMLMRDKAEKVLDDRGKPVVNKISEVLLRTELSQHIELVRDDISDYQLNLNRLKVYSDTVITD